MVGRRLSTLVDLWEGNSLVTDGFSSQRDSNTELCRFCISLSIVLNKHSSCVAINWTYTNTLSAQTTWWPFWRRHLGMYFLEWKWAWFWFYIQWNDFAYIWMNEITNIEDAMISGIVHFVLHIWYDRFGPFDMQDWRNMSTEGRWLVWYAGGCVKSRVPVVVCDRLGPFNTRVSRDMADYDRRHSQRHLLKYNIFKFIFMDPTNI